MADAPSPLVLAFGDSLVAGYRLAAGDGFAPQLEAALRGRGVEARVVNGGVSGNTAGAARGRLERVLKGLPRPPDLAIVAIGGNDLLRGVAPERTREDLDAILARLKAEGSALLLAGMLAPPFLGPAFTVAFNGLFAELARKHGALFYPFFLAGVAGNARLNLPDRVHPNRQGVARMVEGVLPLTLKALGAG